MAAGNLNQRDEVPRMAEKDRVVRLTDHEHGIVVNALYDKHNDLVRTQGPYEAVDQVLLKMIKARSKRGRKRPTVDAR